MKVSNDVLQVLDRAETDGPRLVLTGTLDRKLYLNTAKVLEAAGGKWNRKAKAHLFDGNAADVIEAVILTGEITSTKQQFGYFPTPAPIVQQLIDLADIQPGMRVLEPSAGRGAIALAAVRAGAVVDCVEIQTDHADALVAHRERNITVITGDFLVTDPRPVYDRVVMNPPFAKDADLIHVKHAWEALKPGGRLVSVMSAGVTFRQTNRAVAFRSRLDALGGTVHPLPDNSFKESGTGVNTVIAVLPKPV
ncbi:methyltransferase [Streptomyces tendae]|uniref:methyltransferase n=1 Tax=Streptomyces tendae TaxID=1932 RepID=UPI00371454A0